MYSKSRNKFKIAFAVSIMVTCAFWKTHEAHIRAFRGAGWGVNWLEFPFPF